MILDMAIPPSLHNRRADLRATFVRAVTMALCGRRLPRKVYKVSVVFKGAFYKPTGEPTDRDGDNLYKNLSDVLAECLGWKSDKWFQRDFHVRCEQSDSERVVITLT